MEPRDRSPSGSLGLTKTCPGAPGRAGRFPGASAMLPRSVQSVSWTLPHAAQFDFRFQDASGRPNFAPRRLQDARKCMGTRPRRTNHVFDFWPENESNLVVKIQQKSIMELDMRKRFRYYKNKYFSIKSGFA